MVWFRNLTFGAAAFLAAHAVEVYQWRVWFDPSGAQSPWFLNTGRAVVLTMAVMTAAGAAAALIWAKSWRDAGLESLTLAAGAAVAMTLTLFVVGPGSIFPIVLAAGTVLLVLSAFVGALVGFGLAAGFSARLDRPESP